MRRTDLSLDQEIEQLEERIWHRRLQLRALAHEARSRASVKRAAPVALIAALAVGFAASRFVRKAPPPPMMMGRRPSPATRAVRIAGAIASILLPRLIGPLQSAAAQWIQQRMRRPAA